MRISRLLMAFSTSLLASTPAYASDYSGVLTLIGIPILVAALIALGIISIFPASAAQRKAVIVLFAPLILLGVMVLGDAISVVGSDLFLAVVYILLLAATAYVFARLLVRPIPAVADGGTDEP